MMKHLPTIFITLLLSLSLTACMRPAEDPKAVADQYWQQLQAGNVSEAEKLLSTDSQQAIVQHSERINASTQVQNDGAKTIVSTTITTTNPKTNHSYTQNFNTVLVLEQGQWKVDATETQIPATISAQEEELQKLTEELSESMQENIETIDDAMTEGMQLLNEALHEGSKEMSESMLNLMNELNSSMQESIDKMKERRQQQMQEQQTPEPQTQPQPDPAQGEGMI